MRLLRHSRVAAGSCLALSLIFLSASFSSDTWDSPSFSLSPEALRQAAAGVKPDKDSQVTVLLHEQRISFDAQGREVETVHSIYRIETEEGVEGWAETSGDWEPWHQAKPEIKARVISPDGTVHPLDPKTLNDVPVHENAPAVYSDERTYGGPLPGLAVGAIVEEEVTVRDTAPFFAGGAVERRVLTMPAPVHQSRLVLVHPESLPLRYVLQLLPQASVKKTAANGVETITIENGLLEAVTEKATYLPPDTVPYPELEFATGTSWQQVAQEYARLSEDKLREADVQPLLTRINTKDGSRQAIVQRIVSALHKNARYTGIEFGESALVPQFPAETLKRKYGDCKDKSALLATMLRAAGIPAKLALLSSGPGQDINTELPGMGMFDHAIVYVPASEAEPELWIDATAQYSRVGALPEMDYGRWALIVDEKTTALKKIPELSAAQNLHREVREFTMAEFGPAKIIERNEQIGPQEASYREYYNSDAKQVRENSEKYVKREYLADSLVSVEHGDALDLEKPFSITFVTKGKRGSTDYNGAIMAIRMEDLFDGLPDYFTSSSDEQEKEKEKDGDRAEKRKPRVWDWQIHPFVNEWHYKVMAPPGFKLRALPPKKEEELGTAKLTQTYSSNPEGTVAEVVLRFDSGKSRLTVEEAKALRTAVQKAEKADAIFISFDQIGHSLLAEGKTREGLAAYHELAQLHPKEALHRIQLARALLDAGLAEEARAVAREATVLEPGSAQAYSTLGWILRHDLMGRRLKKGFDYDGAVAAYRKAKELDPKDNDIRANLASLLEYDAQGERYSSKAHLKESVAELRELKKMDEEAGRAYDDNILYDLWYALDFKGVGEAVSALPSTETRCGFVIAAMAAEHGAEAALKKSLEITTEEQGRRKALTTAGWLVLRLHKYGDAAELLAAGARGQDNEAQMAAFAASIKKTKPREELKVDDSAPSGLVQHMFAMTFSRAPDYAQMRQLMSKNSMRLPETKKDQEDFRRYMFQLRMQVERGGMPVEVVGDIALNNIRYTVEGSDSIGYRITVEAMGAEPQIAFVVQEEGRYKILDFHFTDSRPPENLGWQALERLQNNDLAGARKWLDWAREKVHMSAGDDPLSGQPFPYFWTKGQEGDAAAIRTAALVLVPSKELRGEELNALLQSREGAKNEHDKLELDLVGAAAYSAQDRWAELGPVAEKLLKAYPDSMVAFRYAVRAYARTQRLDDWEKLVQQKLAKQPDEAEYVRSEAELARSRSDYAKARQIIKGLMDRSKATQSDLNSYAWDALYLREPVGQDSVDAAERANQLSKNANFSIMHTLACVYAQTGKAAQARDLLLKAMDVGLIEEPDSSIWLAQGEIAEQYGEMDAARSIYARVDKSEVETPTSNYVLAQMRLGALKTASPARAKSAGQ